MTVEFALLGAFAVVVIVWTILEVRHSERFALSRSPMPRAIRNLFMWTALILMIAETYWQTQHGVIWYP